MYMLFCIHCKWLLYEHESPPVHSCNIPGYSTVWLSSHHLPWLMNEKINSTVSCESENHYLQGTKNSGQCSSPLLLHFNLEDSKEGTVVFTVKSHISLQNVSLSNPFLSTVHKCKTWRARGSGESDPLDQKLAWKLFTTVFYQERTL